MDDTPRRLYLRVIVKLLSLIALLSFVYILISGGEGEEESPSALALLQVDLQTLSSAQPQRLEWIGGPLQLLRMGEQLYLYRDRGGSLGCPLAWHPPGNHAPPMQPWPGGYRDQCTSTWYHFDGHALPGQSHQQGLEPIPYRLLTTNLLQIGVSGDNAAPANSPAH